MGNKNSQKNKPFDPNTTNIKEIKSIKIKNTTNICVINKRIVIIVQNNSNLLVVDINNKKHQEFVTYSTDNNNIFQLNNKLIVSKS